MARNRSCPIIVLLCLIAGCDSGGSAKPAVKPAASSDVKRLPGEAELTKVTLTPSAVERLGIRAGRIEAKTVLRTRVLGGETLVAPGHLLTVSSPLIGTLRTPPGGVPEPGAPVKAGQVIFELVPLLSPEAQTTLATTLAEAQGQVDQAEQQLAQATLLFDRAERLRKEKLGGAGAVADAKAQVDIAVAALGAAKSRRDAFEQTLRGPEGGQLDPVMIATDSDGVLKNLLAGAGQKVAAGAPLFEVMMVDPLLVRVPIYVGDMARVDGAASVKVGVLSDSPGSESKNAVPIPAPPTADPLGSTVDLYYRIDNAEGLLRPGQRVGVTLPLREKHRALTVPWSALVRDFEGGAWVYTIVGPGQYVRRRVGVTSVVGGDAVLAFGPPAETEVVADGAAELFGVEFGGNK